MSPHTIDGDAKRERTRNAVLDAAAERPGGIVNVARAQAVSRSLKGPGNSCTAGQNLSRRAQQVAFPERNRRTD